VIDPEALVPKALEGGFLLCRPIAGPRRQLEIVGEVGHVRAEDGQVKKLGDPPSPFTRNSRPSLWETR